MANSSPTQGHAHDFYSVLPAIAAKSLRVPLTFVAFDVLAFGEPVIDTPYHARRTLLDQLAFDGPAWCATSQLHGSVRRVVGACVEHDLEGLVAGRVPRPAPARGVSGLLACGGRGVCRGRPTPNVSCRMRKRTRARLLRTRCLHTSTVLDARRRLPTRGVVISVTAQSLA
jgi:hypothetical protein